MTTNVKKALNISRKLAALTAAAAILTLAAGCDRFSPAAPDELNPEPAFRVNASEIWQRYQGASTARFADDEYKNRWADIKMDGVRKTNGGQPAGIDVVAGTRVLLRTPGQLQSMEFSFRFPEDTEDYRRGENWHRVVCNIKGTDLARTKIEFINCRAASTVSTGVTPAR